MTIQAADRKSPGRALLYSLGGTVVLTPISGLGLLIGPSFGHYYAENPVRARLGIGIRSGIIGGGALLALSTESLVPLGIGSLAFIGHVIYDVITAPLSAKEYNEQLGANLSVAPTSNPQSGQGGLSLQVQL